MEGKKQDDMRFLLEDGMLDDLLGDLAADHALADSVAADVRENPVLLPTVEPTIASGTTEVSVGIPEEISVLSTDADGDQASETASQASSDTTCVVTKKPMTNSTRVRMKQELTYLRDKVVDLEQQLAAAKKSATEMANAVPTDAQENGDVTATTLVTVQSSLWERVARHQRVEKQKAERTNAELRLLLEDQLKIARSLEKALKKRPSATLSSGLVDELNDRSSKRARIEGNSQDPSIFEQLSDRADRSYEELAAIWQRTGFDTCKTERNESQVLVDGLNRLYLEVTTAKIVPFSMQATDHAAWACISQPALKFSHGVYRGRTASPNAIHSNSEMSMRVGDEEAHMHMAIVTKRFEEKNRVVYVLESSCSGGGSRELLQNVQIVERGWVVLEPVRTRTVTNVDGESSPGDQPEAAPMESAILQVCMRLMPAVSNDMATTASGGVAAGALTELMISSFRQNLGFLFQTIENMLVEQMLSMGVAGAHAKDVKENFVPQNIVPETLVPE